MSEEIEVNHSSEARQSIVTFSDIVLHIKPLSRAPTLELDDETCSKAESEVSGAPEKPIPDLREQAWGLTRCQVYAKEISKLCMVKEADLWASVKSSTMAENMYDELSKTVVFAEGETGVDQRRSLWDLICWTIQECVLDDPRFLMDAHTQRNFEACLG